MTAVIGLSGDGGANRALTGQQVLFKYFSDMLGIPITDAVDMAGGSSANTIKLTQWGLNLKKITERVKKPSPELLKLALQRESDVTAFGKSIRQQDEKEGGNIFPDRTPINPLKWFGGFFKTKYDPTVLPQIIEKSFASPTMADFSMDTIFTVWDPTIEGLDKTRLITSYDNPDVLVSEASAASCSFPTFFNAYGIKINGETVYAHDGGLQAINPAYKVYKELKKRNPESEKNIIASMMVVDQKSENTKKLRNGSGANWLFRNRAPIARIPFDMLHHWPHEVLMDKSAEKGSNLEYFPFHIHIKDEHYKKYGVSFSSSDASEANTNAFTAVAHEHINTKNFLQSAHIFLIRLHDNLSEKNNQRYLNSSKYKEMIKQLNQNATEIKNNGVVPLNPDAANDDKNLNAGTPQYA